MSRYLIATGIYPPKIGGPAQYARNLKESLEGLGHEVTVKTYTIEDKLPTGIRHIWFFCKILPSVWRSDAVIILDTFSVGLPTVGASKLLGKKSVIRTGGDFLWEGYVERTKKPILLRNFYHTEQPFFTLKEKMIFNLTRWALNHASTVIFSTEWQRDIFLQPYKMNLANTRIIENFYGAKEAITPQSSSMLFVASTRNLVWKNLDLLRKIFAKLRKEYSSLELFTDNQPYKEFMETMKKARAVILVSLGDISPNMILDAIRLNVPFICTKEVGFYDKIKNAGLFVDPFNEGEIESAVRTFLDDAMYSKYQKQVEACTFIHTWSQITDEFLAIIHAV